MERAGRGFRPRPVEITQRLLVLRSTDELDSDAAASRPAAHGHATLDGSNEEVRRPHPPARGRPAGSAWRIHFQHTFIFKAGWHMLKPWSCL